MHRTMKRVLAYMVLAAVFYAIATFFTESQTAFVVIFGLGLLIGLAAELLFWSHVILLPWKRRKP